MKKKLVSYLLSIKENPFEYHVWCADANAVITENTTHNQFKKITLLNGINVQDITSNKKVQQILKDVEMLGEPIIDDKDIFIRGIYSNAKELKSQLRLLGIE